MEIYKYYYNTKEWNDICNSKLMGKERDKAFEEYIKKHGEKVGIKEYFNDSERNSFWKDNGYSYKCFGEAENCFERLAMGEIDYDEDLSYCRASSHNPEDLCESRTDWDEMKSYADGLSYFIKQLKCEIASGKIVLA